MINDNGLIGDSRRITFSENIKKSMPIKQLMQSFLGCAVVYKGEDTYIKDVKLNNNSNFYFRHADMFLFELENGECPKTNVDLKLYKSDLNDDLETVIERMNSIEYDYNWQPIRPLNYVHYDMENLSKIMKEPSKATIVDELIQKGLNEFLSIFTSLKKVIVRYRNSVEGNLSVQTIIVDMQYIKNSNMDFNNHQIEFNYSDIHIKLAGVEKFIPLTAPNISFVYNQEVLNFGQLLEKHKSGEIK